MKHYIVYTLFFGYLSISILGTTAEKFTRAANLEELSSNATSLEESFSNATSLEDSPDNATDLEKSSSNTTELKVSLWNFLLYGNQNGINTTLEHEFKVAIKGGKGKTKVTGGNKKKITGGNKKKITGGNKKKITGGYRRITSGNRYRNTSTGNWSTETIIYVVFGTIGVVILITVLYFSADFFFKTTNEGENL